MSNKTSNVAEPLVVSTEDVQDVKTPSTSQVELVTEEVAEAPPIEKGRSAEITADDITLPTLRIAHKTGKLGEDFQVGSYVMDGMTQLTEFYPDKKKSSTLEITMLEIQKSFVENVEFGSGQIPDRLYSELDVYNQGKTLKYYTDDKGDRKEPDYWVTFDCRILVKRPTEKVKTRQPDGSMVAQEIASDFFPMHHDGNDYAMLTWQLQRSGYTRAGKRIMNAFHNGIFPCLSCGRFLVGTTSVEFNKGNSTIVPDVTYGKRHDDSFVDFVKHMTVDLPMRGSPTLENKS